MFVDDIPVKNVTSFSVIFILKVQFLAMSIIVAVQTRGAANMVRWVTLFRLELSQDCVTFNPLLNASGSNMVSIAVLFYNVSTLCI